MEPGPSYLPYPQGSTELPPTIRIRHCSRSPSQNNQQVCHPGLSASKSLNEKFVPPPDRQQTPRHPKLQKRNSPSIPRNRNTHRTSGPAFRTIRCHIPRQRPLRTQRRVRSAALTPQTRRQETQSSLKNQHALTQPHLHLPVRIQLVYRKPEQLFCRPIVHLGLALKRLGIRQSGLSWGIHR